MALRASHSQMDMYGSGIKDKREKNRGWWEIAKKVKKTVVWREEERRKAVTSAPLHCVPDTVTNGKIWVKDWERRDRNKKLLRVSGSTAYQFPRSWQEIGSLTTVGQRRLLSQSYSVLDGFNLEQLVDDEPIHMVFKSLSVSSAINLQDSLHLSSSLTDSSVSIFIKQSFHKHHCKAGIKSCSAFVTAQQDALLETPPKFEDWKSIRAGSKNDLYHERNVLEKVGPVM